MTRQAHKTRVPRPVQTRFNRHICSIHIYNFRLLFLFSSLYTLYFLLHVRIIHRHIYIYIIFTILSYVFSLARVALPASVRKSTRWRERKAKHRAFPFPRQLFYTLARVKLLIATSADTGRIYLSIYTRTSMQLP